MEEIRIKDTTAINILRSMESMQTGYWEKAALKRAIEAMEAEHEQKEKKQGTEDT